MANHDWAYAVAVTIPVTVPESVTVAITITISVPIAVAIPEPEAVVVVIIIEAACPPNPIIAVEELPADAPDLLDHAGLALRQSDSGGAADTHRVGADHPRAQHRRGGQCRKQELVHFGRLLLVVIAGFPGV